MQATKIQELYPHPALIGSLHSPAEKVLNFSPGPTSLPKSVEARIKESFQTANLTSLALSHRSPEFQDILDHARGMLRKVMQIPTEYEILFTHGGGHGQFASVPLNLCTNLTDKATYIVNGTWSARGRDEASKYCQVDTIDVINPTTHRYDSFPDLETVQIDPKSKYVYLCSNETVNGVELYRLPKLAEIYKDIPLVVDASSDFSTKPIDWLEAGVGVLFACASKNIGHPGLTLTIVRRDLLSKASPLCPEVFNYTTNIEAGNLWNTPATFNIEVVGFVMDWLEELGGVAENEARCIKKAQTLYDVIDNSKGFYRTPVADPHLRSRMNVPFALFEHRPELTDKFLIESWEQGILGLRTLTPFGAGEFLRASLYNGVSQEDVDALASFMLDFAKRYA